MDLDSGLADCYHRKFVSVWDMYQYKFIPFPAFYVQPYARMSGTWSELNEPCPKFLI